MENAYIGAVTQLRGNLLLGRSLVTDKTDDQVVLIFRQLSKELELKIKGFKLAQGKQTWWDYQVCSRLRRTPIPLDTPVTT